MAENVGAIQGGNQPVTVYDNGGTYSLSPTNAALYGAGSRMPALMAARAKALSGAAGSAGNADVYGSGGTGSGDYNAQGGHAGRLNGWPTAPQALGGTLASTLEAQSQGTPYEGFLSNLYNQFQQPQGFMYGGSPAYAQNTAAAERAQAGQYQQQFGDLGAQAAGVGAYAQRLGQNAQTGLEGTANNLYDYAQQASGYGSTLANRTNPTANYLSQNAALDQASGYGSALANLEQGTGPSGAQALLQQGANQSMDQALALSRSGRGWGGSAQGTAQALRQNAATMQNVGLQASQLKAQEYAAQQQRAAANLGAAAGINQNAAGQYGQQSQFDVNAALQGRQLNDQSGLAYNQLGLNAAQQSLAAQQAAYNFGMQGAQGLQQAITQQGQLGQAGQAAYWQGEQGADTAMARQQQALESYNQAIMQRYGVDKGVAIQNQAAQAQLTGSLVGAGGALLGGLVGAFAGGPAGAVGGAGLGYQAGQYAGQAVGSDVRAKRDIAPAGGVADQLATVPSYSYQYVDPERFGRGPQVGVMAQDLERTPAGSTVVRPAPDGTKMVDSGKTTMLNTAAIGELARRVQQLEGGQPETQYDYGAPYVTSDVRTKELIRPLDGGAEEAPMKFTLSPARAGYRDTSRWEDSHQPRRPMTTAERFDKLDALSAPGNTYALPPSDSARAFRRAAITSGLDAAVEPVRLVGQLAQSAGYPNSAAHLRGQDAAEAIDYLAGGADTPSQYRRELEADAAEHPYFQQAGEVVGSSFGGAPMAALTGRLNPGVGTVLNVARRSGRENEERRALKSAYLEGALPTGRGKAAALEKARIAREVGPHEPVQRVDSAWSPELREKYAQLLGRREALLGDSEQADALGMKVHGAPTIGQYNARNRGIRVGQQQLRVERKQEIARTLANNNVESLAGKELPTRAEVQGLILEGRLKPDALEKFDAAAALRALGGR